MIVNNQPFFSICITAFNAEQHIERCLRSIAAQSYESYEVIVIDDGSAIPVQIPPVYGNRLQSLRVVRQRNSGPYLARKHAFELAKGDYLLSIDSDDELADINVLFKLRESLLSGADIVLFNAASDANPIQRLLNYEELSQNEIHSFDDVFPLFLSSSCMNALWCKAFSKEVYIASKCSPVSSRLIYAEDRLQTFELMTSAKTYVVLDEILYKYCDNPDSTTNAGFKLDYLEQQLFVESEIVTYSKKHGFSLDDWSIGFLQSILTNIKLLGFNRSLSCKDRKRGYQLVSDSEVYWEAVGIAERSHLDIDGRAISFLLRSRLYGFLCLYTVAISYASRLKHWAQGRA